MFSSSKTSRSSVLPPQRRRPGSWMRPSQLATAASGPTPQRKNTGTPTCSSRCISTSTAWKRQAKEGVSTLCYKNIVTTEMCFPAADLIFHFIEKKKVCLKYDIQISVCYKCKSVTSMSLCDLLIIILCLENNSLITQSHWVTACDWVRVWHFSCTKCVRINVLVSVSYSELFPSIITLLRSACCSAVTQHNADFLNCSSLLKITSSLREGLGM